MSSLTLASATPEPLRLPAPARLRGRWREVATGLAVAFLLLLTLFGPVVGPYPPDAVDVTQRMQPPSSAHLMGTDPLGRDLFSRVLAGARVSLPSVLVIVVSAVLVGVVLGALAGYLGGIVDDVIMRLTDIFLAFPALVLALAIAGALGPDLTTAMLAVSIVWWPWYARLTRGQVIARKQELYVEAARAAGCTDGVILRRHVLPNSWTPIVVQSTLDMGAALITTASLGYIGMGAQPPSAEWGAMLSQARDYFLNAWWLTFFPGLAIFLSVLIFTAAGELLREHTTR
ncbi:MAG: ABC transporter permease [Thermomicrobiales bacterium]